MTTLDELIDAAQRRQIERQEAEQRKEEARQAEQQRIRIESFQRELNRSFSPEAQAALGGEIKTQDTFPLAYLFFRFRRYNFQLGYGEDRGTAYWLLTRVDLSGRGIRFDALRSHGYDGPEDALLLGLAELASVPASGPTE